MIQRFAIAAAVATMIVACSGPDGHALGLPSIREVRARATPSASPTPYDFSFTTFDEPKYPDATLLAGIDTSDEVVGSVKITANRFAAFAGKRKHPHFHWLRFPKASSTIANAISPSGRIIVGYFQTNRNKSGSFIFEDGHWTTYTNLKDETRLLGVNDNGDVTGFYTDSKGRSHAFVRTGDVFSTLRPPRSVSATANAISATRNVTGNATLADGSREGWLFIVRSHSFVRLVYPHAAITQVAGMTNDDTVVGTYSDASGAHGFILRSPGSKNEEWQSVDEPNANHATAITGVNKHDDIVGVYLDGSGHDHGFVGMLKH
jgi:uncharacterized membrane protein